MAELVGFHLDENVNSAVARGLRERGINVTTSREAGLIGASDHEQLAYALQTKRVIFTQDADFLIIASRTSEHYGIAFAQKGMRTIGQIIETLILIHGVMTPDEMYGHIEFL
ncbi:MAG: DUF5615 family PIN-like protein [Caldilineaceae bacterium]|nr:DUF5615 family PIN-like protein [Caldilineaceae bacterium]